MIGAGIYGITAAIILARNNSVEIFEQYNDILKAASGINQYRLHRGYHYPRSSETTASLLKSEYSFKREYSGAIMNSVDHYYCIAKSGSFTSARSFLEFCEKHSLECKVTSLDIIQEDKMDLCVKVKEDLIDFFRLKEICQDRLKNPNIKVLLNTKVSINSLDSYDFIVNCTYARLNSMLDNSIQRDYQYELCEKPVVELPPIFNNKSLVVMDGPFMCVDPYGSSGLFVIGNVVHAIHQMNVGRYPIIDKIFLPLLNNGIVQNPPITNFDKFIGSAVDFIPEMQHAKHVGSMYTIRTVLPNVEDTDARPTIVERLNNRLINIFSGKIGNCVEAAEEVAQFIDSE